MGDFSVCCQPCDVTAGGNAERKGAPKADAPKAESRANSQDYSTLQNQITYLRKNSEILMRAINVALRPLLYNIIDVTNGSVATHNL